MEVTRVPLGRPSRTTGWEPLHYGVYSAGLSWRGACNILIARAPS